MFIHDPDGLTEEELARARKHAAPCRLRGRKRPKADLTKCTCHVKVMESLLGQLEYCGGPWFKMRAFKGGSGAG